MKNRLKFSRCYMIGPMDHNREAGRGWRIELGDWLRHKLQVIPIDPYHKPLHNIHKGALEDDDNYIKRKQAIVDGQLHLAKELTKPVVSTDLRIVDHAEFIVCYLDIDNRPCGTFDELFMATGQNKPCIVMCPQGIHKIYDWLYGRLKVQLFFDDWGEVKEYLEHIAFDPDEEIDLLDRWKFFDLEKEIVDIIKQDNVVLSKEEYYRLKEAESDLENYQFESMRHFDA